MNVIPDIQSPVSTQVSTRLSQKGCHWDQRYRARERSRGFPYQEISCELLFPYIAVLRETSFLGG